MASPTISSIGTDDDKKLIDVETMFINRGGAKAERSDEDDDADSPFSFGGATQIEFKIMVRVKCKVSNPDECGEMVPYAASWTRLFGANRRRLLEDTLKNECTAEPTLDRGVPWVSGGPLRGTNLGVDFPCEIFYRKQFPHVERSKPGFEDLDGNETNTLRSKGTRDKPEIKTALETFDVVLRDEPSFTIPDEINGEKVTYVKYEFQSAYMIRDPKRGKAQVAFRRHVTFVYGPPHALEISSLRPDHWDA